jgi:competence protein ComEC
VQAQLIPLHATDDTNNEALVARLSFAGCSAFFDADAEAPAERILAGMGLGAVDLLKVGHHGSRTSSIPEFLRALRPRWALISVGYRNRYRHPNGGVIGRLRRGGATVFRTDFHGYVRFTFTPDGRAHCETAQGDCGEQACGGAYSASKPAAVPQDKSREGPERLR